MAFDYSGTGQYHSASSIAAFRLLGDMTIFAIVQTDTVGATTGSIFSCGGNGETEATNYAWILRRTTANFNLFWENGLGTNNTVTLSALTMTAGTWYRVCAIRDATANTVQFVVNGTDYGADGTGYGADATGASSTTVSIGVDGTPSNLFNGRIDGCGLWNTKLSSEEAIALTSGVVYPPNIRSQSLVEYYPLLGNGIGVKQALVLAKTGSPTSAEGLPIPRPGSRFITRQTPAAGVIPGRYYYDMVQAA